MYQVQQSNQPLGSFQFFLDAWVHATLLQSPIFLKIVGPDGTWTVEPKTSN